MTSTFIGKLATVHAQAQMTGWDFSRLDDRVVSQEPPWDFEADCREALGEVARVIDMGTGGGERLIRLVNSIGCERAAGLRVTATEGWEPNIGLARRNLSPLGIAVVAYDAEKGDRMPFDSDSADLVMARHEAVDAMEIARVLAPGGVLLTQQVDGRDAHELRSWFGGEPSYPDSTLDALSAAFESAGLVIDTAMEWSGKMTFKDTETLVEYMGLVPWDVPGFRVEDNAQRLIDLEMSRPIIVSQRRFLLYARRPAA
ncbi:class I SAM-dependent methyltransferase [Streptomyces sp. NPDC056480]|uniref:class I SAM-dependent methyltransferase n=1 Tax=Streptomyces sp. NPDC056480 TaxID=3345833 RepID=UPI0036D0CB69